MYYNTLHNVFEKYVAETTVPELLFQYMGDDLYSKLGGNFVTAIAILVDINQGLLTYCNAGHTKAFFYNFEQGEDAKAKFLRPNGKVLGVFPNTTFRQEQMTFSESIRLVLYTDGITETFSGEKELYGERRLLLALEGTHGMPVADAIQQVVADVTRYQKSQPTEDDRTILMTEIIRG